MIQSDDAKTLYLVDGTAQLYRAFFALPKMNNAAGMPTNAVFGFTSILRKLLNDHRPDFMAVVFDPPGKTFRNEVYAEYKANRPPSPPDMKVQSPYARKVCHVLGIPVAEQEGFEADDVIATWSSKARERGFDVVIVGSDKDLLQLVREGVRVYNPSKEIWLDSEGVAESFGVPPEGVLDVQGLAGDSVDNIPGVPGVGAKSAVSIVRTYGDLESVIERAARFVVAYEARDAVVEAIDRLDRESAASEHAAHAVELARGAAITALSGLLEIEKDEDLRERLDGARGALNSADLDSVSKSLGQPGRKAAKPLKPLRRELKALDRGTGKGRWQAIHEHAEQARLSRELATLRVDAPAPRELEELTLREPDREAAYALFRELDFRALISEFRLLAGAEEDSPDVAAISPPESCPIVERSALERLAVKIVRAGHVVVEAYGDDNDPMRGPLVGLAVSVADDHGEYIPVGHAYLGAPEAIPVEAVAECLGPVLADPALPKSGHDLKRTSHLLGQHGMPLVGWDLDTMVAGFLLEAGRPDYSLPRMAREHLDLELAGIEDLVGSGVKRIRPAEVEVAAFDRYAVRAVAVVSRLVDELRGRLEANGLDELYRTIDGPLLPMLGRMEAHGVRIDVELLAEMSKAMEASIVALRSSIHELAGVEFNVDSPKQLREVLFETLGLKSKRKTAKSKVASTDAQTLEELAVDHEIARKLLEYREWTKLKSTYVDSLPRLVNPDTGRIHTCFNPTGAATGRLSSSDPNLQNIPARSEAGRRIRSAFIPDDGYVFLASDYSQVELRILAHLCDDPGLKAAFAAGEDIHRFTAAKVSGVMTELVTDTMRTRAKAVNFGILYGMSETRLAREQGMTRAAARQFIESYFERFASVRAYIDRIREQALQDGEVRTLFGRVRRFPQLSQRVHRGIQEQALRAAVNTTIQGTAADLMKMAMLRVEQALSENDLAARVLIQVHDELLLEVPEDELERTRHVVKQAMETVHPLDVPLLVDQAVGPTWYDAT